MLSEPFIKKPLFWIIVAISVAVAIIAVTLIILGTPPDVPGIP